VVAADVNARVSIDGEVVKVGAVTRRLPPGTYRITLDAGPRGTRSFSVLLSENEVVRRVWSFTEGEWRSFEGGVDPSGRPVRPPLGDVEARVAALPQARDCLTEHPLSAPDRLAFVVAPDGTVVAEGLTGAGRGSPAERCLERAVRTLSFPPSQVGAAVTVAVGG